jgi:hypothetical protein
MSATTRLGLGLALLAIGFLLPFATVLVVATAWPTTVKTVISGALIFAPEILAIPAVAIMGKENFERIVAAAKRCLGSLKPVQEVGPVRHWIGVAMFLVPLIPTYVMAYAPAWLPDDAPARLWINLAAELVFIASLFVLGGNFWDKLRALFVREARAVFPAKPGTP